MSQDLRIAANDKADNRIQTDWIRSLLGYSLRATYNVVLADFLSKMAHLNLRPVQVSILSIVEENPGLRQGRIGEALNIARENIAPLVNQLEKEGFLVRRRDPSDRRAFAIYLSEAGEDILDESKSIINDHEIEVMSNLSEHEQRQLLNLLNKVLGRKF